MAHSRVEELHRRCNGGVLSIVPRRGRLTDKKTREVKRVVFWLFAKVHGVGKVRLPGNWLMNE